MDNTLTDITHQGKTLGEDSSTIQPILNSIAVCLSQAARRHGVSGAHFLAPRLPRLLLHWRHHAYGAQWAAGIADGPGAQRPARTGVEA